MSTALGTNDMDLDLDLDQTIVSNPSDSPDIADLQANSAPAFERISILLAHEEPGSAERTKDLFKQANWSTHCHRASSIEDLKESLLEQNWDLVIGYGDSSEFLPVVINKLLGEANSNARSIFLDAEYSATNALQIVQCGFHDYLTIDEGERFLFAVSREVEALHNAQHAQSSASVLAEAEAKSQLLLSTTADAIAYVADGMLIDANTVFVETLGYSDVDDLELMPLMDLVAENSQGEMRKVIKLLSKGDSDIPSTDTYLQNASGESVQVSIDFSAASHEGEACTQIILRGLHGNDISANSPASAPNPSQAGAANVTASASSPAVALRDISALQQIGGKGMVYFVSLSNVAGFRRNIDLVNYAKLIDSIDEKLRSLLPANAFVSCYSGEHWVIATPDNDEVENHLGKEICQLIDQTINNASEADNGNFAAIGISKYGVADMSASDAIEKAFNVCATQLASGGFKLFSPRIDNAQGSAALKSAMELDRLKIKYQPVIGLHNQSTQWYDAFVFMRNDAGVEQDASELLESLGIEKDNVALDQWLVTQSIEALSSLVYENPHISLSVPLTASAISDEHFVGWLMDTVQASGLPKDSISFNVSAEQAQNYEAKCRKLFVTLLENGFKTTIKGVATEQVDIVKACKPDFVQLDAALTENLNAEENNSKEGLKTIISQSSDTGAVCIAVAVNTAADLAQLWQTGIPYVQGSYLQAPLPAMSYEFSDIA